MVAQLRHNGVTAHQGIDGGLQGGFLGNAAITGQLLEEGGEGFVMLPGVVPDGKDVHLAKLLISLLPFRRFRHGQQGEMGIALGALAQNGAGTILVEAASQKQQRAAADLPGEIGGQREGQIRIVGIGAVVLIIGGFGQHQAGDVIDVAVKLDEDVFIEEAGMMLPEAVEVAVREDLVPIGVEPLQTMVKIGGQHLAGEKPGQQGLIARAEGKPIPDLLRVKGFPENVLPGRGVGVIHDLLGGFLVAPGIQMGLHGLGHAKLRCVFQQQGLPLGIADPGREACADHGDQILFLRLIQNFVINIAVAVVGAAVPAIHQFLKGHGLHLRFRFLHCTTSFGKRKG